MGIYLDNAATTPIRPEVAQVMFDAMQQDYGNPSSVHQYGRHANHELLTARGQIAKSINAQEKEIIFTSSGSEGDNLAILKSVEVQSGKGKHIITSAIEHPAVLKTMQYLEKIGYDVTYLPVDEKGQITLEQVKKSLKTDTIFVSLMYGNNEVGTIFPIVEIAHYLRERNILFHTDAVQAYGVEDIDVQQLGVDLLTVAAHKINGPKGIGFLYVRSGVPLQALIHGGEQERNLRAGTENLPAIMGFARAIEFLTPAEKKVKRQMFSEYRKLILDALQDADIEYHINGDPNSYLPHILSLAIPNIDSNLLLMRLDLLGYAVSIGSACTAGNIHKSHVLTAIYGEHHPYVESTVRLSFGYQTTKEEVVSFASDFVQIIQELS